MAFRIMLMCFANGKMRTVSKICERCPLVLHGVVCHQNRGVGFANGSINLASFGNIAAYRRTPHENHIHLTMGYARCAFPGPAVNLTIQEKL